MAERNNYAIPTWFGYLGRYDRNKNAHIYIVSHKIAKMSTVLDNITHDFTKKNTLHEQEHVPFKCHFLLKEVGNGVKPFSLI